MKKIYYFMLSLLVSGSVSAATYYVTPTGSASNSGSSFSNAMNFKTAVGKAVAGDVILLQAGTYTIAYTAGAKNTISFTKSGTSSSPIKVECVNNGRAVIDFSFPDQEWVQDSYGFSITGSYWSFKGIAITRAGYQGAYVTGSNTTFENCAFYNNRNTGLEINKGGSNTTVKNCDAYRNYDPKKKGSMADGFGPKQEQGPGNKFINCRAWENSDDGYDCFDSTQKVTFENCWAIRNGVDVWNYGGFTGNGNGFKVGGNSVPADNVLTKCVAIGHPKKGFDQNNNTGSITLYNCTGFGNNINFGFGNPVQSGKKHIFKNNISLSGTISISNATQQNNSWNLSVTVNTSDFTSTSTSLAIGARQSNGDLPTNLPFKLVQGSDLIDKGTNVGLSYSGSNPDLGYSESNFTTAKKINSDLNVETIEDVNSDFTFNYYPNPVKNILTIELDNEMAKGTLIELFDLSGKLIVTKTVNRQTENLSLENLPSGAYILTLTTNGNKISKRIIKD
ncbi:right-handed parallel beta-helix repeat-containing protein [Flavobacterium sp. LM4]|uniref:right-handed parallel beta-helix repeat-containing protein n=1 Tax=Flavobacterium sp. LM4 TaxID=1938609 RepID=UPI0009CEA6DE|nr:right-handed parallel beta-helix repeat-containing protein [Flavobacterium sp. LM4]OOV18173.1 pectate lyase [Flavobacterium sp. LM4]